MHFALKKRKPAGDLRQTEHHAAITRAQLQIPNGTDAINTMRFIVFGSPTPACFAGLSFAPPAFAGFAIIVTLYRYKIVTLSCLYSIAHAMRLSRAFPLDKSSGRLKA